MEYTPWIYLYEIESERNTIKKALSFLARIQELETFVCKGHNWASSMIRDDHLPKIIDAIHSGMSFIQLAPAQYYGSIMIGARTATTRWICFRVPDSVPPLSAYLSKYTGAFVYWTLVGLYTSRQRVLRLIHVCSTLQPCIIHPVFEPRQYISTYWQIFYFRQGVSLGFNIVTRSWVNWCIIIILTTSTVWLTSIFLPSSLHRLTSRRPSPSCTSPSLSPYHRFQPVLFYGIRTRGSCDNKSMCFISLLFPYRIACLPCGFATLYLRCLLSWYHSCCFSTIFYCSIWLLIFPSNGDPQFSSQILANNLVTSFCVS
jgi:hypothetical protein